MGKRPSKLKRACLRCWPVLRFRVVGKGVARWKRYCVRALIGLPLALVATVVVLLGLNMTLSYLSEGG